MVELARPRLLVVNTFGGVDRLRFISIIRPPAEGVHNLLPVSAQDAKFGGSVLRTV